MAVRKDKVQINIAFITDESKQFAKLINSNEKYLDDLTKAKKEGKELGEVINNFVNAGKRPRE